jgi:hypothetical protein
VDFHVDVAAPDHFRRQRPGDSLALGAVGAAGKHAIQVLAVVRIDVRHAVLEGRHVRDSDQDDRSLQVFRIDASQELLTRENRRVLVAVHAHRQRQDRSIRLAVKHRQRYERRGIRAPRDLEIEVDPLAGTH